MFSKELILRAFEWRNLDPIMRKTVHISVGETPDPSELKSINLGAMVSGGKGLFGTDKSILIKSHIQMGLFQRLN